MSATINGVPVSKTRMYRILTGMKSRCHNERDRHYRWYGAKGITVCEEWQGKDGAVRFCEWALSHGYDDTMTIDRIESDRGYCPDNCMWLPRSVNSTKLTPELRKFYKSVGVKNFEFYDEVNNKAFV